MKFHRNSRTSTGVVTEDSLDSLATGDTLSYVPLPPVGDIPKGIANINNWDWFEGALLYINFVDGEFQRMYIQVVHERSQITREVSGSVSKRDVLRLDDCCPSTDSSLEVS